jgi:predicted aspartyl protease
MTPIRTYALEPASQVPKSMLLVIAFIILSGTLIKSANAQSRNVDGTLLVEVRIDGAPAVLLLDTGAEHSILDQEFAHRLGLRPVGLANIEKPDSSYQSELVLVTNVEIQSVYIKDIKMLTDDLAASSGALGVHMDGVLGNDILGKFTVTLDYSSGSVTFGPISAIHQGVPIKLRRIGDRYFANVRSGGAPLTFLLDTGTNFSSLSQGGWSRLNQDTRPRPAIDGVRSSGTSATSKLVCIPRIVIGRASYENLPMRVLSPTSAGILSNPDISGLLGSDFLVRFVVLLDFAKDYVSES